MTLGVYENSVDTLSYTRLYYQILLVEIIIDVTLCFIMPIPVSETHRHGKGLQAAHHEELPTSSNCLFANLGKKKPIEHQNIHKSENANELEKDVPRSNCTSSDQPAVETDNLSFWYCDVDGRPIKTQKHAVVENMSLSIPRGATVLLIGPNGAGKTTLLKVLAGKHMVPEGSVKVLGMSPFHATSLTSSGRLNYIGGNWERDIAFAGYSIPLAGDIPAKQMLNSMPDVDPQRISRLIEVLDIDPEWRMHLVSDGQRRRVQIAMGLLKPFDVLLLDEITVDLDVLGRADLMKFLQEECASRNATVIYATHIFDGLEQWPSHVMYVAQGQLRLFEEAKSIPELSHGQLLGLVEGWLRKEKSERPPQYSSDEIITYDGDHGSSSQALAEWNNGWKAGRMTSSIKLSSNAVIR